MLYGARGLRAVCNVSTSGQRGARDLHTLCGCPRRYTVLYGKLERRTVTKTGLTLPVKCNIGVFKSDPVPGTPKNCWVKCDHTQARSQAVEYHKRAWFIVVVSSAYLHVRCTPMGRTVRAEKPTQSSWPPLTGRVSPYHRIIILPQQAVPKTVDACPGGAPDMASRVWASERGVT